MRMDFESPDVMKDFPGLYASEMNKKCSNDSDYSDDGDIKSKRDLLIGKRKEKRDKKDKERGYAALEGESSAEESYESRSPSKNKKSKPFKFTSKSKEKREKSREKDKDTADKKKEKEKKHEKRGDKEKNKSEKKERKSKHDEHAGIADVLPIFGATLELAAERSRCHDGVDVPLPLRNCIDFVETYGITMEGLYKVSGTKSKVAHLKKMYNHREYVDLTEHEVPTVTSLLKMFLRDLPEAIFTNELLIRFEEAGAILNLATREKHLKILVDHLPPLNRLVLSWLFLHFDNVVVHEKYNKMNKQHLAQTLSPSLHTSVRLFSALMCHCKNLFPNVKLFTYVPPLTSSAQLPEEPHLMEIELKKQESLLSQIHAEMNAGFISTTREELLWEVQRIITQLKRQLKMAHKEAVTERHVEEKPKEPEPLSSVQEEPEDVSPKEEEQKPIPVATQTQPPPPPPEIKKPKRSTTDDEILLLKYKNQDLIYLKERLQQEIDNQKKEIYWLKGQLAGERVPPVTLPARTSTGNLDEVMDLLKKENQILEIEKINLVRQIMEQQEICIELKARLSVLAVTSSQ